jgi:hypothetical protein
VYDWADNHWNAVARSNPMRTAEWRRGEIMDAFGSLQGG